MRFMPCHHTDCSQPQTHPLVFCLKYTKCFFSQDESPISKALIWKARPPIRLNRIHLCFDLPHSRQNLGCHGAGRVKRNKWALHHHRKPFSQWWGCIGERVFTQSFTQGFQCLWYANSIVSVNVHISAHWLFSSTDRSGKYSEGFSCLVRLHAYAVLRRTQTSI